MGWAWVRRWLACAALVGPIAVVLERLGWLGFWLLLGVVIAYLVVVRRLIRRGVTGSRLLVNVAGGALWITLAVWIGTVVHALFKSVLIASIVASVLSYLILGTWAFVSREKRDASAAGARQATRPKRRRSA